MQPFSYDSGSSWSRLEQYRLHKMNRVFGDLSIDKILRNFNLTTGAYEGPITLNEVDDVVLIGAQANLAGSGIALNATHPYALKVCSDDAGLSLDTPDDVRGVQSRLLLTVNQTHASVRALQGQLKILTGKSVTSGVYTAVQAYVELVGTLTVASAATFSCLNASMELGGGAMTVASGGFACGIHVETTGAGTITNNGTCAAILVSNASGGADWPVGIDLTDSCTTGIDIGACTTGITFSGDSTTAINIAAGCSPTTGLLIAGGTTNAISITGAPGTAAISISGAEAIGLSILTSTPTDGINIAAACANGIAIGGACTTAAINITGAEAIGMLIATSTPTSGISITAACANAIAISGANTTAGVNISGAEAVGISVNTSTPVDGILISAACADAIHISGAATTTGLNVSADCVTGITIGAQTTAGITIASTGIGIEMNGTYNNALRITNSLAVSASTTVRVLDTYTKVDGYHTAVMGATLLVPAGGTGTGAAIGVYGEANIQGTCTGTNYSFGVRGTLQLTNATVLNGNSSIFGAINASMKDDATPTLTAGHVCGIYIDNLIDADLSGIDGISAMIYSANNSWATCTLTYGWYHYGPGVTNLLGLYGCIVGGCVSDGGAIGVHGTVTKKIAIDIDGTTYYLLASTVPTS